MALILRYFTEFGSSGTHCVKVVEGVVLKKFMFDISCPVMSFLYKKYVPEMARLVFHRNIVRDSMDR